MFNGPPQGASPSGLKCTQNPKHKRQTTKHKTQKRDIDAYELSYAQLGHKNVSIEYSVEMDSAAPGPEFRHMNSERTFDVDFKNGKTIHWEFVGTFSKFYIKFLNLKRIFIHLRIITTL